MAQRDTKATLGWYNSHKTTAQIGFNPDGRCLQICRTARNIPSKYPSALSAQLATPKAKRVPNIHDIVPGMVMFFDDPKDNNPFGHIVTVDDVSDKINTLADIVTFTNSVKKGQIVKVRANYFPTHWGDSFQFGATWLNGYDLLLPAKPVQNPDGPGLLAGVGRGERLKHAISDLESIRDGYAKEGKHPRFLAAINRDIAELRETLKTFG